MEFPKIFTVEYVLFILSLRSIVELLHMLKFAGISSFLKKIVIIKFVSSCFPFDGVYHFLKGKRSCNDYVIIVPVKLALFKGYLLSKFVENGSMW